MTQFCNSNEVIDLFSGAGGLSLGAARAGFSIRGAVELDPDALRSHIRNFPNALHLKIDVSGLTGFGLRSLLGLNDSSKLAGIIGGPPCQGFSSIGNRDTGDMRNKLFVDFFRIVAETRPKFFLAENVPGIMNEKFSSIRKKALSFVEDKYTVLPPIAFAASDYGAPTFRTRVFFIGYLPNEIESVTIEDFKPPGDVKAVCVQDALRGLPVKISPDWLKEEQGWRFARVCGNGYYESRLHGCIPPGVGDPIALKRLKKECLASGSLGTAHSRKIVKRYSSIEPGRQDSISKSHRLDPKGFCPTLRAGTGSDRGSYQAVRPLHPTEDRVITPREAARLQGFPDWFQFSPTKWHSFRQIGSSVSPILAERILTVFQKALGLDK